MKPNLILILIFFAHYLSIGYGQSQDYTINVKLENYSENELYLGYSLLGKTYILDTSTVNANGFYTFSNNETIKGGVYWVIMKPNNNFFEILIKDSEKKFTVYANAKSPIEGIRFENAPDNTLFYEYIRQFKKLRVPLDAIEDKKKSADDEMKKKLQEEYEQLDKAVVAYQKKFIENHPNQFTTAIIKANLPLDIPTFSGTKDEIEKYKRDYHKAHFFDNISLSDEKMLRTPILFGKVNNYLNNVTKQHPDSIIKSIDFVLDKMRPSEETFKHYLVYFLNHYAKSNIVGMDAVYVHLAMNYYAKGLASWTEKQTLEKIIQNAKTLEPLLIGKQAPNLVLQTRDGKSLELHQIKNEYTILYFWSDNNDFKKSSIHLKNIQEKFSNRGVKIVAICAKLADEVNDCWKYADENETMNWLHLADPYHRSRYKTIYDIRSTPQIYILGKDKTILFKRIGAEQLDQVLELLLEKLK